MKIFNQIFDNFKVDKTDKRPLISEDNQKQPETNENKLKTLSTDELAKFMGNEVYAIFRHSLTKKEFVEKLREWLNSSVEERSCKCSDKPYDYNLREM